MSTRVALNTKPIEIQQQPQACIPAPEGQKPATSRGEKMYNWLVYSGLNYWANLATSLVLADYFTHGRGSKQLTQAIENTEKTLIRSQMLTKIGAHKVSSGLWKTLALTFGGWMSALLTKPLEDNKRPIVHWLNKKLDVNQCAADGHEMAADEIYIEKEQPQQSWWNIIKRRLISSVVILAAGTAVESTVGLDKAKGIVVDTVNSGLKSGIVPGGKSLAASPVFQRYLGYAALDTFFTAVHATVMRLTNGSRKAKMPKELGDEIDPPGIEKNHEIVVAPKVLAQETDKPQKTGTCLSCVATAKYKRKDIIPAQTHADRVAASEPLHSLAV